MRPYSWSAFVGLVVVAGQTINANVQPNTTINILNVGMVLNEQLSTLSGAGASNINLIGLLLHNTAGRANTSDRNMYYDT